MTGAEMVTSFLQYYDRVTNFNAPGYETDEIVLFLNNAQDEFIKERVYGKNFQPPAYEDNQKRVADIQPLVNIVDPAKAESGDYGAYSKKIELDNTNTPNYLYFMKAWVVLTRTNPTIDIAQAMECKFIHTEEIPKFLSTEFNRLWFKTPVVSINNGFLHMFIDYYTTVADEAIVRIQYVKTPTAIANTSATPDLAAYTHQEIVDIAVRQAMQAIQDPRYQTQVVEGQIKSE